MITVEAQTIYLQGTNYEIGYQLAMLVKNNKIMLEKYANHKTLITKINIEEINEVKDLFECWCPGLNEEIQGFQEALDIKIEDIYFYNMTYLIPQCSQIAFSSKKTANGKPIVARNFEFSHDMEEYCLVKTKVQGKYMHMGTSMLQFGRDEGINEYGLAITMSSCGMPIVNLPHMEKPKIKGLQYWVVIRALLENCKNVQEVILYLQEMPIAFNMNLIACDTLDTMVLIQIIDGIQTIKEINNISDERMLHVTNHAILPILQLPALKHSLVRYRFIEQYSKDKNTITSMDVKNILLSNYPQGLCFHYFWDGFGTTKSILLFPCDGVIEICWGGERKNKWRSYNINEEIHNERYKIILENKKIPKDFFCYEKGK